MADIALSSHFKQLYRFDLALAAGCDRAGHLIRTNPELDRAAKGAVEKTLSYLEY
jgi:hypothetical protein